MNCSALKKSTSWRYDLLAIARNLVILTMGPGLESFQFEVRNFEVLGCQPTAGDLLLDRRASE